MSKKKSRNIAGKGNLRRIRNAPKIPSLESFIEESLEKGKKIILLVDFNNVRGKSDFALTNQDLLFQLEQWKNASSSIRRIQIVCVIDHGSRNFAYRFCNLGLVVFAGPNRTADDVIAKATHWLIVPNREKTMKVDDDGVALDSNFDIRVLAVTSDRELKMRCLRINRLRKCKEKQRNDSDNIKVFDSFQLLKCLDNFRRLNSNSVEQKPFDVSDRGDKFGDNAGNDNEDAGSLMLSRILKEELSRLEKDLRFYDYKHPPWKSGQEKLEASEAVPYKTMVLSTATTNNSINSCQTEEVLYCSPKQTYTEKTWHRVLIAENMRQMMDRFPEPAETTISDVLSQYQFRYNQENSTKEHTLNLFLDHRMRFEPHLQQELHEYFDRSLASVEYDKVQATVNETTVNSRYLLQIRWFDKLKWTSILETISTCYQKPNERAQRK
eukprot:CAMPEP_0194220700 /NCGR_PEP_ID=MMETSP0156-20130528/29040_1 /TAXON_ID=33649 /ORGANISM="Thalassionema nitzschioides, Strain L26-B" /LENGTH=437 /DNA_ID=CAMNT_0038950843 /DNA_START=137 /DNA_END=1450 /DNA_ORIENTATION=-